MGNSSNPKSAGDPRPKGPEAGQGVSYAAKNLPGVELGRSE